MLSLKAALVEIASSRLNDESECFSVSCQWVSAILKWLACANHAKLIILDVNGIATISPR